MHIRTLLLTALAAAAVSAPTLAQPPAGGAAIPQIGGNPAGAPLIFEETWNNLPMAQPMTQAHLSNRNLTLHLYGDVSAIRKSAHPTENYTYTGESVTNWAVTFSEPGSLYNLSRNGKVRLKTRNSGWRLTHIVIRTADGRYFVSEEGNGESTYWIERDYILADLTWRNLMMEDRPTNASNQRQPDPKRTPIIPTSRGTPDLTKIEEIGFSDLMPGGWIPASSRVNAFSVFGAKTPR
jgi:hypothetical protein